MNASPPSAAVSARPSAAADLSAPSTPPSSPLPTDVLFHGRQEVLIGHNGETYRLRITRNGKLILTK